MGSVHTKTINGNAYVYYIAQSGGRRRETCCGRAGGSGVESKLRDARLADIDDRIAGLISEIAWLKKERVAITRSTK